MDTTLIPETKTPQKRERERESTQLRVSWCGGGPAQRLAEGSVMGEAAGHPL